MKKRVFFKSVLNCNLATIIFFLKVWWPYIFAEAHLHIFPAVDSVGGTSMGRRDEIRTRACLTASQRATN
jgi:hypothetical protein